MLAEMSDIRLPSIGGGGGEIGLRHGAAAEAPGTIFGGGGLEGSGSVVKRGRGRRRRQGRKSREGRELHKRAILGRGELLSTERGAQHSVEPFNLKSMQQHATDPVSDDASVPDIVRRSPHDVFEGSSLLGFGNRVLLDDSLSTSGSRMDFPDPNATSMSKSSRKNRSDGSSRSSRKGDNSQRAMLRQKKKQARRARKMERSAVAVQSFFRGHRSRCYVKKIKRRKLFALAAASGVLLACPGTRQGSTGWYQQTEDTAPVYYEVNDRGEWKMIT